MLTDCPSGIVGPNRKCIARTLSEVRAFSLCVFFFLLLLFRWRGRRINCRRSICYPNHLSAAKHIGDALFCSRPTIITRESRRINPDSGVVREHEEADGRGAGERVALDALDVVVGEVEVRQVVQPGERELAESLERRVLERELVEAREAAERERLHVGDGVAVEVELAQRFVALERVRPELADVVLGERQVLDARR